MKTTATQPHDLELFCRIDGAEYSVTADRKTERHDDRPPYYWVEVRVYQPDLNWWKSVVSESAEDVRDGDLMDAIRWAFKRVRRRQNEWVRSYAQHRYSATQEQGGKRGYYTKWANKAREQALTYAPKWKLCKQIWKEITKL